MRLTDWQPRLTAYLAMSARAAFKEGAHDCALFAAGAVQAMTGVDYAAAYRDRYTTTRGGMRILRRDGFSDHVALAAAHLAEKPVARALPGDLAVIDTPDGPALGVVQGEGIFVLSQSGMALVPLLAACKVFEV